MNDASQIYIFDRALLRQRRDRAAAGFARHDVLFEETAAHLIDRLSDVRRDFPNILDLGAHNGVLTRQLRQNFKGCVVASDLSEKMLTGVAGPCVVADEEFLPFAAASFDLVVSNLSLHWVNDLPGALVQVRQALRPDGLFLATVLGGETLYELRTCLMEAELAVTGGVSPRLSPSIDSPTASGLLQRAGFSLPVTDHETITLTYPNAFALMRDVRGMAQVNAQAQRLKKPTRRAVFLEAARLYAERHAAAGGRIAASFEVIFLHGWKPSA